MKYQEARVLVIGKTGNGKSSFINYLLDEAKAPTGIGKPITQEFEEYEKIVDDKLKLIVTDSKGLESNKDDFESIIKNIKSYIQSKNSSDNVAEFFHVVFYCLKYNTKRIEEQEIELIKQLKELLKFNIHFIITGCDSIKSVEEFNEYEEHIKKELGKDTRLYKVCSIEVEKRGGQKTQKYGKEEVINGVIDLIFENLATVFAYDFAHKYVVSYNKTLDNYEERLNKTIDSNIGFFSRLFSFLDTTRAEVKAEFEKVRSQIIDEIEKLQNNMTNEYSIKLDEIFTFCNVLSDTFGLKQTLSKSLNTKALKDTLHFKEYGLWDSFANMFTNNDAKESFKKYFNSLKIPLNANINQNNNTTSVDINLSDSSIVKFLGLTDIARGVESVLNYLNKLSSNSKEKFSGEKKLVEDIKAVIMQSKQ